jgi:hypothetical protein
LFSGEETATASEVLHSSFEELFSGLETGSITEKTIQSPTLLLGSTETTETSQLARDLRALLQEPRHRIIAPAFLFAGQDLAKVVSWQSVGRFYQLSSLGEDELSRRAGERGQLMLASLARFSGSRILRRMRDKTYEGLQTPDNRPDILQGIADRLEKPGLVFSGLYYFSTAILCRLTLVALARKFSALDGRSSSSSSINVEAFGRIPSDLLLRPLEQAFEESVAGENDGTREDRVITRGTLKLWLRLLNPLAHQVVGTVVPCVTIASETWLSLRNVRAAALLTRTEVIRTTYRLHQLAAQYVALPLIQALESAVLLFTAYGVACFENMRGHNAARLRSLVEAANQIQQAEDLVGFTQSAADQWLALDKMELDRPEAMFTPAASALNTSF